MKGPKPKGIPSRFWEKVDKSGACWLWTACISATGYGLFDQHKRAHRLAYELSGKVIPEGLILDHLCRNRACVNPDHLEVVTFKENILRGDSPSARNARKTHCNRGHFFDEKNTRISKRGRDRLRRTCRTCERNFYHPSRRALERKEKE